jgi:hypothetical protein
VRAEDAAIHMRFVDNDVAQVREDVTPAVVVRQHPDMEHVRVGEDQVRPLADLPALLGRGVTVVDGGLDSGRLELGERSDLILRERLRRVEIQRSLLGIAREPVQHGQVEGQRLAGGSPRRDDQVLAAPRRFPRLGLVREELPDTGRSERVAHPRVEIVRDRRETRRA